MIALPEALLVDAKPTSSLKSSLQQNGISYSGNSFFAATCYMDAFRLSVLYGGS
jgi:hypothetical protein